MTIQRIDTPWGYWIRKGSQDLAGVVRATFDPKGAEFVSPPSHSLQVAIMRRHSDYEIPSHEHLPVGRATVGTQEVLIIKSGILRVDLYYSRSYVGSLQVRAGEVLILVSGGHGFVAVEDCTFVEVKQGPYVAAKDKEIFPSAVNDEIPIRFLA